MKTLVVLWIKCTRMVEIKHRLNRCHFNYALAKLIVDNGINDLWRRQNPDSSEFTHFDRSSGTNSWIGRCYTDIKIASNTKNNHIMIYLNDHFNAIFNFRLPSKTKIGKGSWYFSNSFLCKPEFSSTSKAFPFLLETKKTTTHQ